MRKWERVIPAVLALCMMTGCGMSQKDDSVFRVSMVAGTGGINDQSFNQSAWEGLQSLKEHTGADVRVLESKQTADYLTNLDRATDTYSDLIWGNWVRSGRRSGNDCENESRYQLCHCRYDL